MEATIGHSSEEIINKPIEWSEIIGVGEGIIHRFWQEYENGQTTIWDEESIDNGLTWNRGPINSVFNDIPGHVSLATDAVGNLQLLQLVKIADLEYFELQHLEWDGQNWKEEPGLEINIENPIEINCHRCGPLTYGWLSSNNG